MLDISSSSTNTSRASRAAPIGTKESDKRIQENVEDEVGETGSEDHLLVIDSADGNTVSGRSE